MTSKNRAEEHKRAVADERAQNPKREYCTYCRQHVVLRESAPYCGPTCRAAHVKLRAFVAEQVSA